MALINGIIPEQNYEIIREAIREILELEFTNQESLTGNSYVSSYFSERFVNPDETDFPCINVVFAGGDYDNKDQRQADGSYTYHIAAYTSAISTSNEDGDKASTKKLHRVLGICRAILMNPVYKNLGLTAGIIKSTLVSQIAIAKNDTFSDAANSIMGYIEFKVKAIEDVILKDAALIGRSDTTVKLSDTEEGFFYQNVEP